MTTFFGMALAFQTYTTWLSPSGVAAPFYCNVSRRSLCPQTYVSSTMSRATKLPRPILLFVTPDNFSKDLQRATDLSKAVLNGGATLIQIRDRNGTLDDIRTVVDAMLSCDIPPERLVVNGLKPAEVASMHLSLGIHIKEKDIDTLLPEIAETLPPSAIVGCAVHDVDIARRAVKIAHLDYLQVGTMFPTMSHPGKVPEGPTLLRDVRYAVGWQTALVAIGGIEDSNVPVVMEHGADGIAVITLLAAASNPAAAAASIMAVAQRAYQLAP